MPSSDGLALDQSLLARVGETPLCHWWLPSDRAIVVGLGLHRRIAELIDLERCRAEGVAVIERPAGGGAVWLDEHVLCGAICLPSGSVVSDITDSYRWLGDVLARALGGHRVEVAEARADHGPREVCYGALSPHEVVNESGAKVVGLAQVRRRHAALFQIGVLCDGRDQSPLADFMRLPVRDELRRRSAGISLTPQQAFAVVSAVCSTDAMPSAQ